jgi:hypothetical protein
MAKLTNAQFLTAVSKIAPEFKNLAAKNTKDIFTESGYEALQHISIDDPVSKFYSCALLVGMQLVDHIKYKDTIAKLGILTTYNMSLGAYIQKNRVKGRIRNVNPALFGADGSGLKNGDSVDPFKVRKAEIVQDYYGLNTNYQNWITVQDFDLKGAWLSEMGIQSVVDEMFAYIDLDRVEFKFAKFYEVLNGALNSITHPLKDTQQLELESWTDAEPTDAEIRNLIEVLKNIVETFDVLPAVDIYNEAGIPNSASATDLKLLVRQGLKSKIESVMAYVFGPQYLQFAIKIQPVANFGGIKYYKESAHTTELQPVYDENGAYTGYLSEDGTETDKVLEKNAYIVDPNEKIIAVVAEKGVIFETVQNPLRVRSIFNPAGEYVNTYFNEMNNGINYDHTKNLITISKPSA